MKRVGIIVSVLVMVLGLSMSAQATLQDMGDGTIYDTDTQLSWLQNANTNGLMTWDQAVAWAASLNSGSGYAGLTGWRLPDTAQPDASCGNQSGDVPAQGYGYNCSLSEMGHLFYVSLGNKAFHQAGWGLTNTGPFQNLQPSYYWSGTEAAPVTTSAWYFYFYTGYQTYSTKGYTLYAWAVRPGARSTSTPVPASGTVSLMVLGLAGVIIVGTRLRKATRQG